ncbi:hypothetical protein ACJQWK_08094 [Exserohilum turcicum]|uniref:Uncharacterized protein n=1 Tax=Exserohilum turcicum (strain 28A) TaxID=671987 RepID=R0KQS3_EXST2|nr:uncharacterized protein SETTUDRAFT_25417 [Exserohilum turcica Et28A]EOA90132.1 hypothetical protein SETTUDRAFT_25417 [Exserohilum turcica Et28A]
MTMMAAVGGAGQSRARQGEACPCPGKQAWQGASGTTQGVHVDGMLPKTDRQTSRGGRALPDFRKGAGPSFRVPLMAPGDRSLPKPLAGPGPPPSPVKSSPVRASAARQGCGTVYSRPPRPEPSMQHPGRFALSSPPSRRVHLPITSSFRRVGNVPNGLHC